MNIKIFASRNLSSGWLRYWTQSLLKHVHIRLMHFKNHRQISKGDRMFVIIPFVLSNSYLLLYAPINHRSLTCRLFIKQRMQQVWWQNEQSASWAICALIGKHQFTPVGNVSRTIFRTLLFCFNFHLVWQEAWQILCSKSLNSL